MVRERRELGADQSSRRRQDLLGALIQSSEDASEEKEDASEAQTKSVPLTDREVMGNIYVFLLAGHDTTAHTLAFTFGLLGLYPEIQQELYESITKVLPTPLDEMTYEKTSELHYALAVFLETLRVYPSVVVVPKYSMENTLVPVNSFSLDGGKSAAEGSKKLLIPQWAEVMIDVPGLHYNEKYWGEDAPEFRPSRFIDNEQTGYRWPRDAFMGFSQGARACLGQKFAQVEAVTIIAEIIRRFEVVIDPNVLRAGESTEEAKRRLLDGCKTVITLTPKPLPVIFRERKL
jgi:cytochrome P450